MKILLGQSYFRALDPKEESRKMPYPPLGSLIVASYIEELGHEIHFYDAMIEKDECTIFDTIDEVSPDLVLLYDDEFNYLTKMALLNMRHHTYEILQHSVKLGIPSIVYTSDAIDHPELYLQEGADVVVIGEGETVVKELLDKFAEVNQFDAKSVGSISGVAFLGPDLVKTEKKPLRKDLDALPDPNYDRFVDLQTYRSIWLEHHGYFSLNVSTSRGCTFGCNWCAKPLWGRTYNSYSPERVAIWFETLRDEYQVDHIWITDDIFGLQKGWLEEFADICVRRNIKIPYKCLSRADLLLKDKTLRYLSDSGCEIIWIGAESGSQKILDAMEKGTTVDQIKQATREARKFGIDIAYFLQLGYLGETWEDIMKTRKLVVDNLPTDIGISVSYPLPGTKFYNIVEDHLSEKQNWTDSDDLDLMFHGTYPREFYRIMHRVIHNEYRYHQTKHNFSLTKLPKLLYHKFLFHWNYYKVTGFRDDQSEAEVRPLPVVG